MVNRGVLLVKDKAKPFVRASVFLVVAVFVISMISSFFQPVWLEWNNFYTTKGFYKEKKNTIETVFLGASTVLSGVNTMMLYENFGLCAYNLSTEKQPLLGSYYWLEETYRLHPETLKTVFLGASALRFEPSEIGFHKAIDNMKLSKAKYNMLLDYYDGDVEEARAGLLPLYFYHSRWDSLTVQDFDKHNYNPVNGTRGYNFSATVYGWFKTPDSKMSELALDKNAEPAELLESSVQYFEKIVDFCNEKGIKLVLIKTPARKWSSSLHNAASELAKSHNVEYYDFNFSPYSDEINYVDFVDTLDDGRHMNYYGASKLTNWIGKYIVEECNGTDVRNDSKYDFLKDQQKEFNRRYYSQIELQATEDIADYLTKAINEDTTVMIMVRGSAEASLTEKQRATFAQLGLEKLSKLRSRDSYLAVVQNGKVKHEEIKDYDTSKENPVLVYEGKLLGGVKYEIKSSGAVHRNIASCKLDGKEVSLERRGINIVVYDNEYNNLLDSAWFDTNNQEKRDVYKIEYAEMVKDKDAIAKMEGNELFQKVLDRYKLLQATKREQTCAIHAKYNRVFDFIDVFKGNPNVVYLISAKDDASTGLTKQNRADVKAKGYTELSKIGFRNSYVACVEAGKVVYEALGDKGVVSYEGEGYAVYSAGLDAGNKSSIKINGKEHSQNKRGLNIVVYDKVTKKVLASECFDTYSNPISSLEK